MGKKVIHTLSHNLRQLVGEGKRFTKLEALASRSGVGKSTIARARNGESALKIDNLEDIAKAFNLEAWQLLIDNVDPTDPPKLLSSAEGHSDWPFSGIVSSNDYQLLPDDVKLAIREYVEMKVRNNPQNFRGRKAS